ncbi:hypothetical protein VRU48_08040 [Pedobacter sp. KR3-3]|uniref:Uncharacterized protein n=1 Tax=Pedobacter albus TaxID=3113905 RepID=A0ABU7I6I1_9SPHI|nr:hypothetical protein [Pedobacter sp. KR3-3]MEE1945053.1 hypothetical protein [Pedobacter sp. KR3-3]
MREHLANLLFEEFKQQCLLDELQEKGIDLSNVCVNNLDIVLDIIGFPKDNSSIYDLEHFHSNDKVRNERKKMVDKNLFLRDWLFDKYYEMFTLLNTQHETYVTDKGIQIRSGADSETIRAELLDYIDWLYNEFNKLSK